MPFSLHKFSLKAPPPKVVLLPDSLFFCRVAPIAEGASDAEVATQIDLVLESLSPFPLNQLFYGYRWIPGARHALIYACYRKRFTAEQTEEWGEAEVVLPRFAALLSASPAPATTLVVTNDDGITAIHWGENPAVPTGVVSRTILADTGELERRKVRDELVRSFGGTRATIELTSPPSAERDGSSSAIVFRTEKGEGVFTREQLDSLDVRDKTELTSRRRARSRDLFLWRAFVTCAAGLLLALVLELALVGGHVWQRARQRRVEKQSPVVAEVMRSQALATRIQELSTNRLRPFEMIILAQSKKPPSVTFLRATTNGLYSLDVEAYTSAAPDVGLYQAGLRTLPQLSRVEIQNQVNQGGVSNFHLILTFRPDAFRPSSS